MQGKSGENTAIPKPRILRLPALAIPRGRLRARLVILGTLFVMTGCTGLLAEQAFEKLLGTLLGASTPAAAVVLSVYFLGLSLGAAGYARIFRGVRDPLRVYAFLEGGVALWSLLLFLGFGWLVPAFAPLLRLAAGSFPSLQAARFLVAVCWILPPTFLMGASFPAIVAALEAMRAPQPHRAMARFYTLNLLGAVAGALFGPYLAFPRWGVDGTILFTFLVDGLVCLAALWLGQAVARTRAPRIQAPAALARPLKELPPAAWVLIGIAALSGFSFFSLEVFWVHLISAVLGNSVYAFAAMLALVLTGLLLGGMIATALLPRRRQVPGWLPGAIYLAASATLLWQFGRWDGIPHQFTIWGAGLTTFAQSQVLCWIQAGIQILPLAVLMGTVYPLLFRLEGFPGHSRAAFAGLLAAANSVGCITGALFTGFLLIPWLGSETGLTLIGAGCVVAGWLLCFASSGLRARILASTAALGMAGLWFFAAPWNQLALTSGEHVYFRPFQVFPGTKLLFFQEDTSGGMTTVVRNLAGSRDKPKPYLTLLTNGKFQGNDSEEVDAQTGFALIPMLHAHAFDTACVIGLGTGRTAQAVNAMGFSSIHIAEIAPGIPQAARGFFTPINHHVLDQPNVSLFLEDGRNLLLLHPERRYDLIAMEITSVWFAGSTSLYCREFFELTRSRLRPGGIFQQWIQLHHIGPFELGSVLATVRSVYPQVEFWVFGGQGILVASESPITLNPAALARFSARAGQGLEIPPGSEQAYLKTLLESRLLAAEDVSRMVRALPLVINTDRNRYLEFTTPRYNLSPLPHLKLNVSLLGRFATFPPFQFAAGSLRDTEDAQKWVAGADPRRAFQRLLDPGATGARP